MKDPRPDRTADPESDGEPPDFESLAAPEDVVRGERTRDDFFDAVLGLSEPATASDVADLAGRGVDAAREYLEWFEELGIVTRVTDTPATYQRNQAYLNWRRVQRLREEYSNQDLIEFLQAESEQVESLSNQFDAASPEAVSITEHASETDRSIEDVWDDVSAWKTARRRIDLLERALTAGSGGDVDERTAV